MDANQGSEAQKVAQTETQAGKEGSYSNDRESLENFEAERLRDQENEEEEEEKEETKSKSKDEEEDESAQSQTNKDVRHAASKINDEIRKKTILAEKLLEKDPDAIYEIAEDDPSLAQHLLKKHKEYQAETVEELVKNRDLESADLGTLKQGVQKTSDKVEKLQKKLVDSEIRRLRGDNPDLEGDLEETFRELVQRPDYEEHPSERVLAVARALLDKEPPQKTSKASDVAEEMLNAVQGSMPSAGGKSKTESQTDAITPDLRRMMQGMGVSEETFRKHQKQGRL